ncbi:MAG: lysophospholipid acyltransferase family protein [Pirellulaceae bacterium]|jgi:1-acyl-sn-glycerol-3-phosphate acyltransferase|nr:1-acyl-sn-glycerol-3-phosphate acyltransferase [Pirellulaceae bacterium]MDG2470043.1 lysophospholipid acyltransferase family protein [Pirellulaceae bacterium]
MNLTAATLSFCAKLLCGAKIRWINCQPDICQRIYFANHTSHLDAIVLWSSLPKEVRVLTRPVAAKDYWDKGVVRRHITKALKLLLIDRHEITARRSPIQLMMNEIGQTDSLIVFPEGGRSASGELGEFKSGLYYMSKKRPELELVPVYMDNMNRVLPRGEILPVPLLSCISIGAPMWLEAGESKVDFLERARNAVLNLKSED